MANPTEMIHRTDPIGAASNHESGQTSEKRDQSKKLTSPHLRWGWNKPPVVVWIMRLSA